MRKCFEKYFLIFLGVQNSPQSLRVSLKVNKRRLKSNSSTIIDGFLKYEELFKKILSYLLGVSRFFHSLLLKGVQTSAPWNKPEFFKTWEAVSKNSFLLSSELPDVFTTSDSRWDKSSIFGNFFLFLDAQHICLNLFEHISLSLDKFCVIIKFIKW